MAETKRPTYPDAEEILGGYFPVLDHGFVALVDYMGSDQDVERAARVSYGHGTRKRSATRGLVRYLRRHRHTSPSEMVELKFHACMPIFVARQWVRHRTASLNEYSARYSLLPLLYYTPGQEDFAQQSVSNRQGREDEAADPEVHREAVRRWNERRRRAGADYEWLLANDVARELARIDLPASVYTQWYWKIDLHNLFHFLSLRCDEHAQLEIRRYADVMAGMVRRVAPLSYEAWIDYEFGGAHLSRVERRALSRLVEFGDGGLRAADGAETLDEEALRELGLSGREIREFRAKLDVPERPDFELDLAEMEPAEHFRERMEEAVPEVEEG
jgi:thymidylate synthase (FAD)